MNTFRSFSSITKSPGTHLKVTNFYREKKNQRFEKRPGDRKDGH